VSSPGCAFGNRDVYETAPRYAVQSPFLKELGFLKPTLPTCGAYAVLVQNSEKGYKGTLLTSSYSHLGLYFLYWMFGF